MCDTRARTRIIRDQKALERVVPGRLGKHAVELELPALAQLGLRASERARACERKIFLVQKSDTSESILSEWRGCNSAEIRGANEM